ncbi:SOS response-associated peptidase [Leeuwenhoekiella sp. MAR_2009_132]|uniref:SOS response-associated peptidase n=1 Tax=Leeuwenhoekiella sp. MAR_2009_132 TaxID=1392489 RepID=UPI00048CF963|nr:SOS response-associated peptidase [Leeuwenhoekiella sp. MAR_2009_132]
MCSVTILTKSGIEIQKVTKCEFAIPLEYQKYYSISDFGQTNLHIITQDDPKLIYPANWGLIPRFAFDDQAGFKYNTLNARSESIFKSNTYKESAESMRCLILADGFFEPHHYNKKSQPYYCTLEGHKLFMFAGLFTPIDDELFTTTIITVPANDLFEKIHNEKKRMPLVLDDQFTENWIDPTLNQNQVNELMKTGFTNSTFKTFPVSNAIYKRGVDTDNPEILKPVTPIDPELDENRPSLF